MNHGKHTHLMIGLAVAAGILLFTGTSGGVVTIVWLVGCAAMMFFMMRGMGGMDHGGARKDETLDKVDHEH